MHDTVPFTFRATSVPDGAYANRSDAQAALDDLRSLKAQLAYAAGACLTRSRTACTPDIAQQARDELATLRGVITAIIGPEEAE